MLLCLSTLHTSLSQISKTEVRTVPDRCPNILNGIGTESIHPIVHANVTSLFAAPGSSVLWREAPEHRQETEHCVVFLVPLPFRVLDTML